jgi:hypothetical protein
MAKATTTIRQVLNYQSDHEAYFAANQSLFNRVTSFYFEVIQSHEKILDLGNMDALRALEQLTHTTEYPALGRSNLVVLHATANKLAFVSWMNKTMWICGPRSER